jgi:hypothetical protein
MHGVSELNDSLGRSAYKFEAVVKELRDIEFIAGI